MVAHRAPTRDNDVGGVDSDEGGSVELAAVAGGGGLAAIMEASTAT